MKKNTTCFWLLRALLISAVITNTIAEEGEIESNQKKTKTAEYIHQILKQYLPQDTRKKDESRVFYYSEPSIDQKPLSYYLNQVVEPTIQERIRRVANGNGNMHDSRVLLEEGVSVIPLLIEACNTIGGTKISYSASSLLRAFDSVALPYLLDEINDPECNFRLDYISLLFNAKDYPEQVIPTLMNILSNKDDSNEIRAKAATILAALAKNNLDVLQLLLQNYDKENPTLAPAIFDAASRIAPESNALPEMFMEELIRGRGRYLSEMPAWGRKMLHDPEVYQLIVAELDAEEPDRIRFALLVLRDTAGNDPKVRQKIISLISHSDYGVRDDALRILAQLTDYPDEIIPAVVGALSKRKIVGYAQTLGKFGEKAACAAPLIWEMVDKEKNNYARKELLVVLSRLMPRNKEVARRIIQDLKEDQLNDLRFFLFSLDEQITYLDIPHRGILGAMVAALLDYPKNISDKAAVKKLSTLMRDNNAPRHLRVAGLLLLGRAQSNQALKALKDYEAWVVKHHEFPELQADLTEEEQGIIRTALLAIYDINTNLQKKYQAPITPHIRERPSPDSAKVTHYRDSGSNCTFEYNIFVEKIEGEWTITGYKEGAMCFD